MNRNVTVLAALAISGVALSVSAYATPFKTEYAFQGGQDGYFPVAAMTLQGTTLYGTTRNGGGGHPPGDGTVFAFDPSTKTETVLLRFNTDIGRYPGFLYGSSSQGTYNEPSELGSVFQLDPLSGAAKSLYTFTEYSVGASPSALVIVDSTIYFVTTYGGPAGSGGLFKIDIPTDQITTVVDFPAAPGPVNPTTLIYSNGLLYGTTLQGGNAGVGTLFSVNLATGSLAVLHSFGAADTANDGATPSGIVLAGSTIYGSTSGGGANNIGSLFSFDINTMTEKTVYSFVGPQNGCQPASAPLFRHGSLYGTTTSCGTNTPYGGTVYKFNTASGIETTLHQFKGPLKPNDAMAGLVYFDGFLYGSTVGGGSGFGGTIFKVKP